MLDISFDTERTVLEALCAIQDIQEEDNAYDYPVPTYVFVEVQGKNSAGFWETINEVWTIVGSSNLSINNSHRVKPRKHKKMKHRSWFTISSSNLSLSQRIAGGSALILTYQ